MHGGRGPVRRTANLSRQFLRVKPRRGPLALMATVLGLALTGVLVGRPSPAVAQSSTTGRVQGFVVDRATGAPVAGATVGSADLGLASVTGAGGAFVWSGVPAPPAGLPIDVRVVADGYGAWAMFDVLVFPDDTLILSIELESDPVTIRVPPPRSETPGWVQTELSPEVRGAAGDQLDEPLPSTIRVRVTNYAYCDTSRPYTVRTVDFQEYVKHVLPNEWITSWPRESLRAGAMAVKMYAWQIVADGGKWSDADVYDSTCDQVYIASRSYSSTNRAVDFTWNWRLTKDGLLVRASYRAWYSQCLDVNKAGRCLGQWESYYHALGNNGYDKLTWDEILYRYYRGTLLTPIWDPPGGFSLRYYGNGWGDIDRVKIPIDSPSRPVDIGAGDFTLEWWMKAALADNGATGVSCGPGDGWINGNILVDRDVYGPGDLGDYGVSLSSGRLVFGAAVGASGRTICGTRLVADNAWHHVAVTRRASDGRLQIYLDGTLDGEGLGPPGDLSYADGRSSLYPNDPFLVLGAEKHDAGAAYPSYSGLIDEFRISDGLRYTGPFPRPTGPFSPGPGTVGLFHFDEGFGNLLGDTSGAAGGPSSGVRNYGGITNGPEWTSDSPWFVPQPTPTPYGTTLPTATASPTNTPTRTASLTSTASPTALASATPTGTASPSPPTPTALTSSTPSGPAPTPTPAHPSDVAGRLTFQSVAGGLAQPVFVGNAGDGTGRLFVLERAGRIRIISSAGALQAAPFLDIASLVGDSSSEQGLLGLAFHPGYSGNGRFFVAYTDNAGSVVLARYLVSSDPSVADPSSAQVLLTVAKPFSNHNGGMLAFGPDGYLYLGIGDGGGGGDPNNYAQDRTTLLGKILRLDVDSASPYAIPAGNPFVGDSDPAVRGEIWAFGLRNPWRFSFDRSRGDLYIGDVGQGSREEVDFQPAGSSGGQNYGWRAMEGSLCYNPATGCATSGKVTPIAEYDTHSAGSCAVTGGYVYRGTSSAAMRGVYLFGDYCSGRIWGVAQQTPGAFASTLLVDTGYTISSFGEDQSGELYLTDYAAGAVVRIVGPAPASTSTPSPTASPTSLATPTTAASPTPPPTPGATPTGTPVPADISLDGLVNVLDLQLCVNAILGTISDPGVQTRSDVNRDGRVDVLDVQAIVNVILFG